MYYQSWEECILFNSPNASPTIFSFILRMIAYLMIFLSRCPKVQNVQIIQATTYLCCPNRYHHRQGYWWMGWVYLITTRGHASTCQLHYVAPILLSVAALATTVYIHTDHTSRVAVSPPRYRHMIKGCQLPLLGPPDEDIPVTQVSHELQEK